jgi:hypothetical protein
VRDRSDLEAASRKIDLVAPEELEQACLEELQAGFSMDGQELLQRAARRLGIKRVPEQTRRVLEDALVSLLERGEIAERDGRLSIRGQGPAGGATGAPDDALGPGQ